MGISTKGKSMNGVAINGKKISGMAYNGQYILYQPKVKIVTFADGTDEEIAAMLEAHYAGKINIEDYWTVGDTRKVHLNAMSSGTGANESHVAQDMTFVIIGFNHDNLASQLGTKTNAALTVQCKEVLANGNTLENGYVWGMYNESSDTDTWINNPRRTWCNTTFINAMPNTFNKLIKTVNKKNLKYHGTNLDAPVIAEDKIFLLSCSEIYGDDTASITGFLSGYYKGNQNTEGTQYEYYKTNSNRRKLRNNNGIPVSEGAYATWLTRSPSSYYYGDYWWFDITMDGGTDVLSTNTDNSASISNFAPAFCL